MATIYNCEVENGNITRQSVEVAVLDELPDPPEGFRWVGPIPPRGDRASAWDAKKQGALDFYVEHASSLQPTLSDGVITVQTNRQRVMARTSEGWWVAVPRRPSFLVTDLLRTVPKIQGWTQAEHPQHTRRYAHVWCDHGPLSCMEGKERGVCFVSDMGDPSVTEEQILEALRQEAYLEEPSETEVSWEDHGDFRLAIVRAR